MATGPGINSKLSAEKAHLHPLIKGKEYTIQTNRHPNGRARIAFMAFLIKGKKRELLLKVDELTHGRTYTVNFAASKSGETLWLTYWHHRSGKWTQITGEKV